MQDTPVSPPSERASVHRERNISRLTSYFSFMQRKWTHFSGKHQCSLIPSLKRPSIINEIVDSGIFINCRRKIRQFMMVSDRHPYTRRVFKSQTDLKNEEIKHLVKYYWRIHPFSLFALYYNFFMGLLYLYTLIYVIPTNWIFVKFYIPVKWHTFAVDMIVTAGIFINFFIGYFDQDLMHVQMKSVQIAKKYLLTYFFFDVTSCLTSYFIYYFLIATGPTPLILLKWTMVCRLVRFRTINESFDIFRLYRGYSPAVYVSVQMLLKIYAMILICLGFSCFVFQLQFNYLPISEEQDKVSALSMTFDTVAAMFGVFKVPNFKEDGECLKFVTISSLSMFLHFWLVCKFLNHTLNFLTGLDLCQLLHYDNCKSAIAKLYTLWQRILVASQLGEDHIQQIGSYLEYKGLPPKSRDEVFCYFDFTYQKKFFNEPTIINLISENLRKEIPNYKLGRTVEKVKFIKRLPHQVITRIVSNMEMAYYCPGDVVFRAGSVGKTLFYIKYGTVALFDENGVEVCHLEDDSFYGDISVIMKQIRPVTMMAISPCEIYKLKHRVLVEILDSFPTLKEKVFEITRQALLTRKHDWVGSFFRARQSVSIFLNEDKQE